VKPARRAPPGLVLGVTSLDLPARTTRDRALEVAGRFREPESLAVTLVKALDAGAEAVYAIPAGRLRAALAELRRPVPVLARLPLLLPSEDLHDEHPLMTDAGEGWGGVRAGLAAAAMLPETFRGDLAARVVMRCEHEAPAMGARAWAGLAIAAPVTDLALASGHAKFFERLLRFGRARFGRVAGFESNNLALLVDRLAEWGIEPDFVIGAVNPRGVAMKPDSATVRAAIRRTPIPVIASELRAGGTVSLDEGARFARECGARGLLPELVDLDDVASELRALSAR
jgi:hypothetical protein